MTGPANAIRAGLFIWHEGDSAPSALRGSRCVHCGAIAFPFRQRCIDCDAGAAAEEVALANHGEVFESTVVYAPAPGFLAPYRVGYVDLSDGVRVFTQIDAPSGSSVTKGTHVGLVFRPFASDGAEPRVGFAFATRVAGLS
jgi:uncharacterized OB-fold protein